MKKKILILLVLLITFIPIFNVDGFYRNKIKEYNMV